MKKVVVAGLVVLSFAFAAFIVNSVQNSQTGLGILSPAGGIKLDTELPEDPEKMPMYRVVGDESIKVIKSPSGGPKSPIYLLKRRQSSTH